MSEHGRPVPTLDTERARAGRTRAPWRRRVGTSVLGVALATSTLVLGACGDSDGGSSATTESPATTQEAPQTTEAAASADRCRARDQLRTSLTALLDVDLVQGGTDALDAALADVRSALAEVEEAAGDDLGDEVDEVRTSLDELQAAVAEVPGQSPGEAMASVGDALTSASGAMQDLLTELAQGCD